MTTILRRHGPSSIRAEAPAAVTIGNFDGLHLGHRSLVSEVVREKSAMGRNARAVVISFYPHPGEVLGKSKHLPRLTTLHQKLTLLSDWGVDELYLIHFTKAFSQVSAKSFIDDILLRAVGADFLIIGPDARVGHNKEGTPEFLSRELTALGKSCRVVSFIDAGGAVISSRRIRGLIVEGRVEEANALLGRPFAYRSRIVRGDRRGRLLGFPTANLHPNDQVVPQNGIYAARLHLDSRQFDAAVSVGVRPTFNGSGIKIEAHILDYTGPEIYGRTVEVAFIARIRDELKFSGEEELKAEMRRDVEKIRAVLKRGA